MERRCHHIPRAMLLAAERLDQRRASACDRFAMLRGLEPDPDLVGLAGAQPGRFDLGRLVLRQVEAPGELPWIELQLRENRPVLAPPLDRIRNGRPQCCMAAERVEQVPLPALVEQPLLVMLAM